jgi:hypothetical protein
MKPAESCQSHQQETPPLASQSAGAGNASNQPDAEDQLAQLAKARLAVMRFAGRLARADDPTIANAARQLLGDLRRQ